MFIGGGMAKYEESKIEAGYQLFTKDPGRCVQRPPPPNYLVLVKIFSVPQICTKRTPIWDFLVAQWLRTCLPTQETQVRSLVRNSPTCHRAAEPVCHNC